jgi:hypothetical protein
MPSLKKSSPSEMRNVCDSLIHEVIASNNEKLKQMDALEKILEPVRDNVQIGAVKILANIAIMREEDKKHIAKMLELQKEIIPEMKGGINMFGVTVNTTFENETFSSTTSFTTKIYNAVVSLAGIAAAYLGGNVLCNIIGKIVTALAPAIKKFVNQLIIENGKHHEQFSILGHTYHPYATIITTLLFGVWLAWYTSPKFKDKD